jgi:tetratricopeptide (TPR) repeat protein
MRATFADVFPHPARYLLRLLVPVMFAQLATASPASPDLQSAMASVQAGDLAAAKKSLDGLLELEPANTAALRVLGTVCVKLKDTECAESAYRKVLDLDANVPQAQFGLAVVFAMRKDNDQAFAWLARAKSTHRFDMTNMQNDENLAGLRSDPRYAALLPDATDFAEPFVEPVKIIREWDAESANDQFGWIARKLDDVDGDGAIDFVTSAPGHGANAGRVYAYSSRTGKLLWSVDGKPGEQLGTGVESVGDSDGDGVADAGAGAPGGGKAYVYSGKDGHVLFSFQAENAKDQFGQHIATAGDVNRDGHADIIVGAPANNADGKGAGRAYVYSGKDGHLLHTLTGERAGDAFGSTVGGYADAKHNFLLVGAPGAGPGKTGRVYVYERPDSKPKFTIESDATGNALGLMFISVLGDTNGDQVPDIYASDWSNTARGRSTGRVYVHSGADGKRLLTLTGETAGEGFGTTLAVAGDVDGDGNADLIVGSWQYAGAVISGGRAVLYSGKTGEVLKTFTCRTPGDTFGFDAVGLGDIDGDGTDDLLITSAWSSVKGFHSGRVFIVSSGVKKKPG